MGASPKDKRKTPTKKLEDYVLTYESGPGISLFPVNNIAMSYVEGQAGKEGSSGTGTGVMLDIGFTFEFDKIKYRKLYVDVNGWCALPYNPGTFSYSDVLWLTEVDNNGIKQIPAAVVPGYLFTQPDVLLAIWFDDLRSVWRTTNGSGFGSSAATYLSSYALVNKDDVDKGLVPAPPGIDSTMGGVKYFRGNDRFGKFLVVRWKCLSFGSQKNVVMFDLVLYESGMIEYRYAPRVTNVTPLFDEEATIGIFCYNAETPTEPRYRDFGYVLKRDIPIPVGSGGNNIDRGRYDNGGAIWKSGFECDSESQRCYWTTNLSFREYWPGLGQFGAIFRFTPPMNRKRQNRSVLQLRDNEQFTQTGSSYFDDQKVISNTVSGSAVLIEYPSMLPVDSKLVSLGDPTTLKDLHQSGSIQVVRSNIRPGLYDSVLRDSILSGRRFK